MKCLLVIISVFLFTSCTTKNDYYGEWLINPEYNSEYPEKVLINKDSIVFKAYWYNYYKSFRFDLRDSKFKYQIKSDTLLINNISYVRKCPDSESILKYSCKVSLTLPRIKRKRFKRYKGDICELQIGLDKNSKPKIQLNDSVFSLNQFPQEYLFNCNDDLNRNHNLLKIAINADSKLKMIDIEKILLKIQLLKRGERIAFLNNMILDKTYMEFRNDYFAFMIAPLNDYNSYCESVFRKKTNILPPPSSYYSNEEENKRIKNISTLAIIDNEYSLNNKSFNLEELRLLIEKKIRAKEFFIITYNLSSDLAHFLKLYVALENIFYDLRSEKSIEKFEVSLNELYLSNDQDKIRELQKELPWMGVNGFSLEHLNSIRKEKGSLYGITLASIPQLD